VRKLHREELLEVGKCFYRQAGINLDCSLIVGILEDDRFEATYEYSQVEIAKRLTLVNNRLQMIGEASPGLDEEPKSYAVVLEWIMLY
jgi:uncharacterized Rmd1/YagE family protein